MQTRQEKRYANEILPQNYNSNEARRCHLKSKRKGQWILFWSSLLIGLDPTASSGQAYQAIKSAQHMGYTSAWPKVILRFIPWNVLWLSFWNFSVAALKGCLFCKCYHITVLCRKIFEIMVRQLQNYFTLEQMMGFQITQQKSFNGQAYIKMIISHTRRWLELGHRGVLHH